MNSTPITFVKSVTNSSSISRAQLAQLVGGNYEVVSTDLFDTLLLRDFSLEQSRFDQAAQAAALRLGLHAGRISALRKSLHSLAYRAAALERPLGDVSLASICRTISAAVGRGGEAANVLQDLEVETDIRHLTPNRNLVAIYEQLAAAGKRIIAVTDTYYSECNIHHILDRVIGRHPIERVYASCEIGLTKHAGALFAEVARLEGVSPDRIVHLGDDPIADDIQARAAGLQVIHVPRPVARRRAGKLVVRLAQIQRPLSGLE